MQQPQRFIYFRHFTAWDYVTTIGYAFVTAIVFFFFRVSVKPETQVSIFGQYAMYSQWALLFFNYKSLRNFSVFVVWIGYALVHLITFYSLKSDPVLYAIHPVIVTALRNTWMVLVVYQLLRVLSFILQDREYVTPVKHADVFNERTPGVYDLIIFCINLGTPLALLFV